MVPGAYSDDDMIQLKVVTGTLNSQKYQDEILKSGVRTRLDSLDGQNIVLRDDITRPHCTRIIEEYKNQQNIASLPRPSFVAGLEPYRTCVGQARLTCWKPETIVCFSRIYCMTGTRFHVLNACTQ